MKLIMANKDEQIVGVHMVGEGAAEMVQCLAVAVQKRNQ